MKRMVALLDKSPLRSKTALRARGATSLFESRRATAVKSSNHIELERFTYDACDRLGSCSNDPIGFRGSRWSLYEYVGSNPVLKRDPSGKEEDGPVIGGAGPYRCVVRTDFPPNPCANFDKDKIVAAHPKFKKLFDCAVTKNCLKPWRFLCKPDCKPGQVAAYVPPLLYLRGYIYICPGALSSPDLQETLLEEAYHALTICARGNKVGGSLDKLNDMMRDAGLSGSLRRCGACVGRELLAKACAKGNTNPTLPMQVVIQAFSSCNDCDPAFANGSPVNYPQSPLGQVLSDWWAQGHPQDDCDDIDDACGAN